MASMRGNSARCQRATVCRIQQKMSATKAQAALARQYDSERAVMRVVATPQRRYAAPRRYATLQNARVCAHARCANQAAHTASPAAFCSARSEAFAASARRRAPYGACYARSCYTRPYEASTLHARLRANSAADGIGGVRRYVIASYAQKKKRRRAALRRARVRKK